MFPEQIVDYLALVGDSSDNIPGVPKVGPKTAAKWLNEYGSLDAIIEHAGDIQGKVGESLRENLATLELSKRLATIRRDVPLEFAPAELTRKPPDIEALTPLYQRLELNSLLRQLTAPIAKDAGSRAPASERVSSGGASEPGAPAAGAGAPLRIDLDGGAAENLARKAAESAALRLRHRDDEPRLHAGGDHADGGGRRDDRARGDVVAANRRTVVAGPVGRTRCAREHAGVMRGAALALREPPRALPATAWAAGVAACAAIGASAAWAGPSAALLTAAAIAAFVPAVWVLSSPTRAMLLYAFVLPLDVYLSTTLRVTSTQVLQVSIFAAWMVRLELAPRPASVRPATMVLPYRTGAALVCYLVLSLAWSIDVDVSVRSVARTLGAILMAVYAAQHADSRQLGRYARAMCYGALVTTLYGFVQYARGGYDPLYRFFSPFYTDPFLWRGLGFSVVATFSNPNILAGYMLMIMPLAWASQANARGGRRIAWLVVTVLFAAIMLLTFSKASWLLLLVLIALWAAARLPAPATLGLSTMGGIALGSLLLVLEPLMRMLVRVFPNTQEGSVDVRLGLWWAAIGAFLERPLHGFGLDGFAAATADVRVGLLAGLVRAHNLYLQTLVDLGLIGSVLVWTTCLLILRGAWKVLDLDPRSRSATLHLALLLSVAAYFLVGLVDAHLSNQYMNTSWLVLGLLAASTRNRRQEAAAQATGAVTPA